MRCLLVATFCISIVFVLVSMFLTPISGIAQAIDPTLDAAINVIAQATRQELYRRNEEARLIAQTKEAQMAEASATVFKLSVEQTRTAIEERWASATTQAIQNEQAQATLTVQAQKATETRKALDTTGTSIANARQTAESVQATATQVAVSMRIRAEQEEHSVQVAMATLRMIGVLVLVIGGSVLIGLAINKVYRIKVARVESQDEPPSQDEIPVVSERTCGVVESDMAANVLSEAMRG